MNATTKPDAYGELIEPTTLKIQRLLPGPIERIWAYLTDSDLRSKWLAAGAMEMEGGAPLQVGWGQRGPHQPPARAVRAKGRGAGGMEMKVGAPFEFVWRNDELNDPPSKRPVDFPEEHRM